MRELYKYALFAIFAFLPLIIGFAYARFYESPMLFYRYAGGTASSEATYETYRYSEMLGLWIELPWMYVAAFASIFFFGREKAERD